MNTPSPRRILGIPVSFSALTNSEAHLRGFEPENPDLFIPRSFGAGWDLNIGALAVKFGLIRPDDSLPDLAAYIPPATTRVLRFAPVLGAAAVTLTGVRAALTHDRLPSNWGITLQPTRWTTGPSAMAAPVLLSLGSGIWATFPKDTDHDGIDVTSAAQALGIQTMSLLLIAAATRRADNPEASRLWPALGLIAAPAMSTGILVTVVRSALENLDRKLQNNRPGNQAGEAA